MSRAALANAWADDYEKRKPNERAIKMARLYVEEGMTLQEIADVYGLTRERVRQVIRPFGLEAHFGRRRKEERARRLKEAHARIVAGESTTAKEAERLGYVSRNSLWGAFSNLGLTLPSKPRVQHSHGDSRRYASGCRCDLCRAAHATRMRSLREGKEPKEHGTVSGYFNYGCRCGPCREAGSLYRRELLARKKSVTPTD